MTDDIARSRPLTRRSFIASAVAAAIAAGCSSDDDPSSGAPTPTTVAPTPAPEPTPASVPAVDLPGDPFTLGVASGDPTESSVILWTRLAPDPLSGGGMPGDDIEVMWEVATDDAFTDVVRRGSAVAMAELAHSVHVDADGLEPDSSYHYRFTIDDFTSPLGRTRTFPAADTSPPNLRFGFSSCQNWEQGFYAAHRHAAAEDLAFFVWLGDYIYESGAGDGVRTHNGPEIMTLDDYRNRYALYKTDLDLQAHHAARPWLTTWDDHEVENNYAGDNSENADPIDVFRDRRAGAYLAWYEHMPVRLDPPDGPDYEIHRDLVWGDLARFFVMDGRQYRADQPRDGESRPLPGFGDSASLGVFTLADDAADPANTFLGAEQQRWLIDGMAASTQTWNFMAQQVLMQGLNILGTDPPLTVTDLWDGYAGSRREVLEQLAANGPDNIVVLTGDFHSAAAGDVRTDPFDLDTPVVASEFMATSISSAFFDGAEALAALVLATNPQLKFFDARKGYTVCEMTPDALVAEYRAIADPADPDSPIETIATFDVAAGTPGVTLRP